MLTQISIANLSTLERCRLDALELPTEEHTVADGVNTDLTLYSAEASLLNLGYRLCSSPVYETQEAEKPYAGKALLEALVYKLSTPTR